MSDKCQSFQRELSNLLDEKVAKSAELTLHLQVCNQCQAYEKELSFLHVLAKAEPMEEAPLALKAGIMARLRARRESNSRFSRFIIFEFVMAMAACVFLAIYDGPMLPHLEGVEMSIPSIQSFYPEALLAEPPTDFSLTSFYPTELMKMFNKLGESIKTKMLQQMSLNSISPQLLALLLSMTILTLAANVLVARSNGISVPERTGDHVS